MTLKWLSETNIWTTTAKINNKMHSDTDTKTLFIYVLNKIGLISVCWLLKAVRLHFHLFKNTAGEVSLYEPPFYYDRQSSMT